MYNLMLQIASIRAPFSYLLLSFENRFFFSSHCTLQHWIYYTYVYSIVNPANTCMKTGSCIIHYVILMCSVVVWYFRCASLSGYCSFRPTIFYTGIVGWFIKIHVYAYEISGHITECHIVWVPQLRCCVFRSQ